VLSGYLYLLLTAAIWGFAFVAQRLGNASLDPFTYNALRFALGAVFIGVVKLLQPSGRDSASSTVKAVPHRSRLVSPLGLGLLLFMASSLQQCGMLWTTAGAAGFITGLYVVIVPLLGILRRQKLSGLMWVSSLLAVVGLGLINDFSDLNVSLGNALVLIGAFFWAGHVQMIDKLRQDHETLELAFDQYAITALLSLGCALVWNLVRSPGYLISPELFLAIAKAAMPIVYGGIFSVGIAFSLQAYAQKRVAPAKAAVILCSEAIFALLGGWWILSEVVSMTMLAGAALVLLAMLLAIRM